MRSELKFDVIVVGGSYSGLAAGMALGRALRKVLIVDSGNPCNKQTPRSHNFLTNDGRIPKEISNIARQEIKKYSTVNFVDDVVTNVTKEKKGFGVFSQSGEAYHAKKIVFATGIKDIIPSISGFSESWGISVLHCPYCHGFEVKDQKTGIIANGDTAIEMCSLISNWTSDLVLYTNGKASFSQEARAKIESHNIQIVETEIKLLEHNKGNIKNVVFENGFKADIKALYTRLPFVQHCEIPEILGCELTSDGYIKIDGAYRTTIPGSYACGDNVTRMRTVANAVSMGTTTGMIVNKDLIDEEF